MSDFMIKKKPLTAAQPYSGFFLTFEENRRTLIHGRLQNDNGQASESFSSVDWEFETREVVLLSLEPGTHAISGLALMHRMHGSGGTGKLKMRLEEAVMFPWDEPVKLSGRLAVLNEWTSSSEIVRRLEPTLWQSVIDFLKRNRPQHASQIDALLLSRTRSRSLIGDDSRIAVLAQQRDAVGTALDIGGMDRADILGQMDVEKTQESESFLDLLDGEKMHEQDAIRHEEYAFRRLFGDYHQSMAFRENAREVRIHVVDKKPLEKVVGIDLLIYQEAYKSLLLLQYKMMEKDHSKMGTTWSYTFDRHMEDQQRAMQQAVKEIDRRHTSSIDCPSWRLNNQPFYWKFCERTRPKADEGALLSGITLSFEHLQMFAQTPVALGARNGIKIGYDNCPRYLNNSQFTQLAAGGWIGGGKGAIEHISRLIRTNQEDGRQAMLAVVTANEPLNARTRGRRYH